MTKKRNRKNRDKEAMDVEPFPDGGGWQTGPTPMDTAQPVSGPEAMDTTENLTAEPSIKSKRRKTKADRMDESLGLKLKPGKRGNRTAAQKKRKAKSLSKALGHADRREKTVNVKQKKQSSRSDVKQLWTNDKRKTALPEV